MPNYSVTVRRGSGTWLMATVALLLSVAVSAQVYQWKDKDGNVHFGDAPPQNANAQTVDLPPSPSQQQVEQAQGELQQALDARKASDAVVAAQSASAAAKPATGGALTVPEFACYTPIEQVLRGPTKAAYTPVEPTAITETQRMGVRKILGAAAGNWYGTGVELNCSGQVNAPNSEVFNFDVTGNGIWRSDPGLLLFEKRARGSRRRVDETRVSYIEVGEALYFFEVKGDGNQKVDRTISLPGNRAEGLYLDQTSFAFMSKRRSYHVVRTEIRHFKVSGRNLEFTELYFYSNLLTGSRVWKLSRR